MRSKHFAQIAWNSACEACEVLAAQEAIANFDQKAKA